MVMMASTAASRIAADLASASLRAVCGSANAACVSWEFSGPEGRTVRHMPQRPQGDQDTHGPCQCEDSHPNHRNHL